MEHKDINKLPPILRKIYNEVVEAFISDSNILAGIGLRTLIEAICIDKNVAGKNLKDKIENLHKNGAIATNELPIIHKLREIGNISAHRIESLPLKTLETALLITNHCLKSIYIMQKFNHKLNLQSSSKKKIKLSNSSKP